MGWSLSLHTVKMGRIEGSGFRLTTTASLWFRKISIVFEDLSRNSVFFPTKVKPYILIPSTAHLLACLKRVFLKNVYSCKNGHLLFLYFVHMTQYLVKEMVSQGCIATLYKVASGRSRPHHHTISSTNSPNHLPVSPQGATIRNLQNSFYPLELMVQ